MFHHALSLSSQLTILICHDSQDPIAGAQRLAWIRELVPAARVELLEVSWQLDNWVALAEAVRKQLGSIPELFVYSAEWGARLSACLALKSVRFQAQHLGPPLCGEAMARNPYRHWPDLLEPVRAFYTLRVVLSGAECSGKTSLAEALAAHYQTWWVPEYGRFYWEAKRFAKSEPIWNSSEFVHISSMQNQLEDHYARRAHKILFCDTDAFTTAIWHFRYLKSFAEDLDPLWKNRRQDLVLFCASDIPFVQDGVRDGETIRHEMAEWIRTRYREAGIAFMELQGSHAERFHAAREAIDSLLLRRSDDRSRP